MSAAQNHPRIMTSAAGVLLAMLAVALPWELFRRMPWAPIDVTLIDVCAGALIVFTFIRLVWERGLPRRTGIEAPLLFFAGVCVVSTVFSMDRAASLGLLRMYGLYLLLFYALTTWVNDVRTVRTLGLLFSMSAAGVALLGIACMAGLTLPVNVAVSGWSDDRAINAWRAGAMVRIAAVSNDFNQGALPLLLGLTFVCFMRFSETTMKTARGGQAGLALLLFVGIVVTLSRSAILAGVLVIAIALARHAPALSTRQRYILGGMILAISVAAFALFSAYMYGLWLRMGSGIFVMRNPSYEVRIAGLRAALEVAPRCFLTGVGLNNSDAILHASSHGPAMSGTTLHSVPLKLFVETGLFGLMGYLWLWWRTLELIRARVPLEVRASLTAVLVALFAVLAVQPFMALPLMPFWFGIGLALAAQTAVVAPPARAIPRYAFGAGMVAAVAVIGFNAALYQYAARQWLAYADTLEQGAKHLEQGEPEFAKRTFLAAAHIASGHRADEARHEAGTWNAYLESLYFSDAAAYSVKVRDVYQRCGAGYRQPVAAAAALFATGQAQYAAGESVEDALFPAALTLMPDFAAARFWYAEWLWRHGLRDEARTQFRYAAEAEQRPANGPFSDLIAPLDRRISELRVMDDANAKLALADLLRRRGALDESAAVLNALAQSHPETSRYVSELLE